MVVRPSGACDPIKLSQTRCFNLGTDFLMRNF
jgi:hypothetical protein